jgi:hypothetical protein
VPLRNLLFIAEQVPRHTHYIDESVPLNRLLTLTTTRLWKWKEKLKGPFRLPPGTMLLSPITAIPLELSRYLLGKVSDYPLGLLNAGCCKPCEKNRLLRHCVV